MYIKYWFSLQLHLYIEKQKQELKEDYQSWVFNFEVGLFPREKKPALPLVLTCYIEKFHSSTLKEINGSIKIKEKK